MFKISNISFGDIKNIGDGDWAQAPIPNPQSPIEFRILELKIDSIYIMDMIVRVKKIKIQIIIYRYLNFFID